MFKLYYHQYLMIPWIVFHFCGCSGYLPNLTLTLYSSNNVGNPYPGDLHYLAELDDILKI